MDRVGERPASPSTTNRSSTNSSNSCHSRDYGRPRRSYYRLFPSVEPTPPASPVSLHHHQRASLRNSSASHRRRSSSADNGCGARDSQHPSHVLANPSASPSRVSRKSSIPELSFLRTVQEDGHSDAAVEVRSGFTAVERSEARALADCSRHNSLFNSALGESTEVCYTSGGLLSQRGNDGRLRPHQESNAAAAAVGLGLGLGLPAVLALDDNLSSLSQGQIHARTKPRPNLRIAIVKQTTDEAAPSPPPKPAQHSREGSAESSSDGSMRSRFLAQDRSAAREVRVPSVALKQSIVPLSSDLKIRELTVAPLPGHRQTSQQFGSSTQSNVFLENKASEAAESIHRPASPLGRWAGIPSLASRFSSRAGTPEPYVRTATTEQYATNAARPATSQCTATTHVVGFSQVDYAVPLRAATPDVPGLSALEAARANVAALNNSEVPTWTAGFSEQSKTQSSELGSVSSRRPSPAGFADPTQTLAELAEQFEALHARHATLRAQRQQISSGIIANLKDQKPGPEYGDMLLNEQLSLAAVSSSIDICFAKLKSLECRREDAIAALVAQATAAQRAPFDTSYAATSRKSSLVTALEPVSRIAIGRSTPDIHSLYHSNRPPPTKALHESQRFRSLLNSQTSTETELHSDLAARTPNRLTQIREPPATPDSSYDTAGASSTTDEMDDSQVFEPSDVEYELPEELLQTPPRTDKHRNSAKAGKVSGIGLEDAPVSPLSTRSDVMKEKARAPALDLHVDPAAEPKGSLDVVSPLTSSTLTADDPDRDLELQLQSFPSAPVRPAPSPPVGQDVAPGETKRARRNDSPVQRRDTAKSYASAHTINVYFDGPHPYEDLPTVP